MSVHHLMLFVHVSSVVVWIGGMAFAYFCLRPAAVALPPPQRLTLWAGVLSRFFQQVWIVIVLILASGFSMLFETGYARAPLPWNLMQGTGIVMVAVFVSIWAGPWRALQISVAAEDWARGAKALNRIRQRVAFNLALGALTIAIATLGQAWR
ncbi:MAG: hypothetical protein HYS20_14355 [Rhodocyclales bacterium]|nr:hypothetical protein [Rhodocyclales bacterium]